MNVRQKLKSRLLKFRLVDAPSRVGRTTSTLKQFLAKAKAAKETFTKEEYE